MGTFSVTGSQDIRDVVRAFLSKNGITTFQEIDREITATDLPNVITYALLCMVMDCKERKEERATA